MDQFELPCSWCCSFALKLVRGYGFQVADGTKAPDNKRCRVSDGDSPVMPKVEEATTSDGSVGDKGTTKQGKGKSPKPAVEPPKDYVHVRARRGQATDSHSLAERVNTAIPLSLLEPFDHFLS